MIGTIVNTVTIIAGTIIGTVLHRGVKEKYKEVLYTGLGLASLAIGLNATISHFSQSDVQRLLSKLQDFHGTSLFTRLGQRNCGTK
mgnify:CR=1 FL=1